MMHVIHMMSMMCMLYMMYMKFMRFDVHDVFDPSVVCCMMYYTPCIMHYAHVEYVHLYVKHPAGLKTDPTKQSLCIQASY